MALRKPGGDLKISYVTAVFLGDPKIGKTRMAGMFPDAYFHGLERGRGCGGRREQHLPPQRHRL
jgi:hypothetical protein